MVRGMRWMVTALLLCGAMSAMGADLFPVEEVLWEPQADEVYLQEVGEKYATEAPVTSLAYFDDAVYAVIDGEVYDYYDGEIDLIYEAPKDVLQLVTLDDALWAITEEGIYRYDGISLDKLSDEVFVDLCMHLGDVYGATREDIYRYEGGEFVDIEPENGYLSSDKTMVMEDGTQLLADPVRVGPIQRLASYSGTLHILRPGSLALFDGSIVDRTIIDWGRLPSPRTRDMMALGSRMYITTDKGLTELRGQAMKTITGKDGLPYEDTTCLVRGFDKDVWIGTTTGAIRMTKEGDYHYFGAPLWLPGDNVHAIAVNEDEVYIATDGGIATIRYEPYTLAKKAAYYERHMEEWGHKRLGSIHLLYWGGDDMGWVREISDNDGSHTGVYAAAMSFKYAVTGDEAAREEALDCMKHLFWMEEITPKEGFIARAIWSVDGDRGHMQKHGSGGLPAKWYKTDDEKFIWKGDTSSDEVSGHYFPTAVFYDLAANGPEKARTALHAERIARHIKDNGWVLRDMDDKPTRWGRWGPDYLQRPYGFYARGLNGMEIQSYITTALKMSGKDEFQVALDQLLDWGYHHATVRQRITAPPHDIAPWDDGLAFWAYYCLLRYADDPVLRSIYLRSLERTWEIKRLEHVAYFNIMYGAMTGNDCELDHAVNYMREFPIDLRSWGYKNSHRNDLFLEEGYTAYGLPYGHIEKVFSPREMHAGRGGRSPMNADSGGGGNRIIEPTNWLLDYWMARYFGMLEAPTVTDPKLITVAPTGKNWGAPVYSGTPRPEILIPAE